MLGKYNLHPKVHQGFNKTRILHFKSNGQNCLITKSTYLHINQKNRLKFKNDSKKYLQITLENFPDLFPNLLPLSLLVKEVEIGKVYAADIYSLIVEQFVDSKYGAILETVPSHVMAFILKIDSKYTYAALLEKSRRIRPGDFVVLKNINIKVYDPLDIFGIIQGSRLLNK